MDSISTGTSERFAKYLSEPNENGCILWKGSQTVSGYGMIGIEKKNYKAHRIAFFLANGYFPPPKDVVGHKCDVKLCCNPDHLEHITHEENMRQMVERKRSHTGTLRRLTHQERMAIYLSEKSIAALAKEYNVHTRTIERVRASFT